MLNTWEQGIYSIQNVINELDRINSVINSNAIYASKQNLVEICALIESFIDGVRYGLGTSDSLYTVRELTAFMQDMSPDDTISLDMLKVLKNGSCKLFTYYAQSSCKFCH